MSSKPFVHGRTHERTDDLSQGGLGERRDLRGRFCSRPWDHLEITPDGQSWVCCPAWLKTPIGNCSNTALLDVWNSPAAQDIRRAILDGSFSCCNHQECPIIQDDCLFHNDNPPTERIRRIIEQAAVVFDELPLAFNLCYDESCNLTCPSCRNARMSFTEGVEYEKRRAIHETVMAALFAHPHDRQFRVNITGSGDPFASKLFRTLLTQVKGCDFPGVVFDLQTNGLLFTPAYWRRIASLHRNLGNLAISLDAATPETYADTRRGGRWSLVIDNVRFLGELRQQGYFTNLRLDFVVQQRNFREMPAFASLAKSIPGVDQASFSLITDWGSYSKEEFPKHAVWKTTHPEFDALLDTLKDPRLADPIVFIGQLAAYRRQALAR